MIIDGGMRDIIKEKFDWFVYFDIGNPDIVLETKQLQKDKNWVVTFNPKYQFNFSNINDFLKTL